jgi:hypothetical protein
LVATLPPGERHRQLTLDGSRPRPLRAALDEEAARFRTKVMVDPRPGGCHHWIGAIGDDGYGRFQAGTGPTARTVRAHRLGLSIQARSAAIHHWTAGVDGSCAGQPLSTPSRAQ